MPGALITADPATVERSGSSIRHRLRFADGLAWCEAGRAGEMPEKPLEMHRDQPGQDASISTNRPPFHRCSREGEKDPPARPGDRFPVRPVAADTREPGDLPPVPGPKPIPGCRPAASTEVVMAERRNLSASGAPDLPASVVAARPDRRNAFAVGLPPSALPGISPTRGEITRGFAFPSHRRGAVLKRRLFGEAGAPSRSPSLWGRCPAGQRGVTLRHDRFTERNGRPRDCQPHAAPA
jgi:hypothetical protein